MMRLLSRFSGSLSLFVILCEVAVFSTARGVNGMTTGHEALTSTEPSVTDAVTTPSDLSTLDVTTTETVLTSEREEVSTSNGATSGTSRYEPMTTPTLSSPSTMDSGMARLGPESEANSTEEPQPIYWWIVVALLGGMAVGGLLLSGCLHLVAYLRQRRTTGDVEKAASGAPGLRHALEKSAEGLYKAGGHANPVFTLANQQLERIQSTENLYDHSNYANYSSQEQLFQNFKPVSRADNRLPAKLQL